MKKLLALWGLLGALIAGPALAQGTIAVNLNANPTGTVQTVLYGYGHTGDGGHPDRTFDWSDPTFAGQVALLNPPLDRINWDGAQMDPLFPTRASANGCPNCTPVLTNSIGSWLAAPHAFPPATRFIANFGGPPTWMDITQAADRTLFANMYVAVNHQFVLAGIPLHYWEPFNERNQILDATSMGLALTAIQTALKAVDPLAQVGGPAYTFLDNTNSVLDNFLANAKPDFFSWHDYPSNGQDCPTFPCDIPTIFGRMIPNAQSSNASALTFLSAHGQTGTPIFKGEYNMCSCFNPDDARQQTGIGAVFALEFLTVSKKVTDTVQMGGLWDLRDDGNFAAIQPSKPGQIGPQGVALRQAAKVMPGSIVSATASGFGTPGNNLDVFVTRNGGNWGLQILNWNTSGTLTANITGLSGSTINQFIVNDANLAGSSSSIPASALTSVQIPPATVIFLSSTIGLVGPGQPLPPGDFHTSGNQIMDGGGDDVKFSCVEYTGAGSAADMQAIRTAGYNCVKVPYFDRGFQNNIAPFGFANMDTLVTNAGANTLRVIWEHRANEGPFTPSTNLCNTVQQNGLPYDLNSSTPVNGVTYNSTNNTDGCGATGTITYAQYKANIVSIATHYAGNSTVAGIDLHNQPKPGTGNTPQTNWLPTDNGSNIRTICSDTGGAVQAADPTVLVICEGIVNPGPNFLDGTTMVSIGGAGAANVQDLSLAQTSPVTGVPNLVYGVSVFPTNVASGVPDSGTSVTAFWNKAFGNLVINKVAPLMVTGGASLDNTNGALADDQNWGASLSAYILGTAGGGPSFTTGQQGISNTWYAWGNNAGTNPNGTLNTDGVTLKPAQTTIYFPWEFTGIVSLPGSGSAWNPADKDTNISLSNTNLTATSTASVSTSVRTTTSKTTGKWCGDLKTTAITNDWDFGLSSSAYVLNTAGGLGSDLNGIGYDPNFSTANPGAQGVFFNNVILSQNAGSTSAAQTFTFCADLGAHLFWATSAEMRAAGNNWNNSPTASPAAGTGGASFVGITCPCFVTYNNFETASDATLSLGTTAVTLPSGFSLWDQPGIQAASNHGTMVTIQ